MVAQAVQASLGTIPQHALAVGVQVAGAQLRFQLSSLTEEDEVDMDDIKSELEALVGNAVEVDRMHEVRSQRVVDPADGVCWIFLARS